MDTSNGTKSMHVASATQSVNDGVNNMLPSDAVDAISALFDKDKLEDVGRGLENYEPQQSSVNIFTPPIGQNDHLENALPPGNDNETAEIPEMVDMFKVEPSDDIVSKTEDDLLQNDDLPSEHLVYTTLDSIKSNDENLGNSSVPHIKQEPIFSTSNFDPQVQLQHYPIKHGTSTPIGYPESSCHPLTRTEFNQNYFRNMQLRWTPVKQQVMVNALPSHSTPISMYLNIVPENEYVNESASTSSSLMSSSTSDPSPNGQKVNSWNNTSTPPVVLGQNGFPMTQFPDDNGNIRYYDTAVNDRESHNMKERQRRARVTRICSKMRIIVPGVTETTDKATVFQRAAMYIQFLQSKMGREYDYIFIEKTRQRPSVGNPSETD